MLPWDKDGHYKAGLECLSEEDYAGAQKHFQAAAKWGHAEAASEVGTMLLFGIGINQNQALGFKYLSRAAELGSGSGANNLGLCYREGVGADANLEKAAQCFKRSASLGFAGAKANLGSMMLNGEGLPPAIEEGYGLLEESAIDGVPSAQYMIGKIHERGLYGYPIDFDKAKAWYEQAAEAGEPHAQNALGAFYLAGFGSCKRDRKKAAQLLTQAANQGDYVAQYNLGLMLKDEAGRRAKSKAYALFQLSSASGYSNAKLALAECYMLGIGVKRDKRQATAIAEALIEELEHKLADAETSLTTIDSQEALAKTFDLCGQAEKAIEAQQKVVDCYNSIVALSPGSFEIQLASALDALGFYYYRSNNAELAIECWQKEMLVFDDYGKSRDDFEYYSDFRVDRVARNISAVEANEDLKRDLIEDIVTEGIEQILDMLVIG